MSSDSRRHIVALADEVKISTEGLDDDQLDAAAIMVALQLGENPHPVDIARIFDEVRGLHRAEVADSARGTAPSAPTCSSCTPHFVDHTPAGGGWFHHRRCGLFPNQKLSGQSVRNERKARLKLIQGHQAEDARTGVLVVPRRPRTLPAAVAHPACRAAVSDGAEPCSRCRWLLGDDAFTEDHLDDADDR